MSNLPVGGTTGLCHQSSAAIDEAAAWFAANRSTVTGPQIITELRRRFGLTPLEAINALRAAGQV